MKLQKKELKEKEITFETSYQDSLYFASNVISFASDLILNHSGYSSAIDNIRVVSSISSLLAEPLLVAKNLESYRDKFIGVAFAVTRLLALNYAKRNLSPIYQPVSIALSLYSTYCVMHKAFNELNKCYEMSKRIAHYSYFNIAKTAIIHSTNACFSFFHTVSLTKEAIQSFNPGKEESIRPETPVSKPPITETTKPPIPEAQIHEENSCPILMVTAGDKNVETYANLVSVNQKAYAIKKGYCFKRYSENVAKDRAPYWSKIAALKEQMNQTKEGQWIAWIDASAIITNTEKSFEEIIETHGEKNIDLIMTNDPQIPINNAVFLIKNTGWSRDFLDKVWSRQDLAHSGEGKCTPLCHYEQEAMTDIWEKNPDAHISHDYWSLVRRKARVIPNTIMNSFYRFSHYDIYRDMYLRYDGDAPEFKWQPGQFICKVTGMDKDRRLKMIQYVLKNCINKECRVPKNDSILNYS